jgi:hypothetical protein
MSSKPTGYSQPIGGRAKAGKPPESGGFSSNFGGSNCAGG